MRSKIMGIWCFLFGHKLKDILSHVYCQRCNKTWTFFKIME